jgi:predicted metal-dependent hydrolase
MTTPPDLHIRPRNIAFRGLSQRRPWLDGDPVATALFNALSATFPQGERFFMDSVRRYRGAVEGVLAEQVAAFIAQEALHTREHVGFNRQLADQGYDIVRLEARTQRRLDFARTRPPLLQLGVTIALEHFTAILAHELLADRRHLDGADPEATALWRWHAIEEIEHKAVAFDTFMVAARAAGRPAPVRWLIRFWTMVLVTLLLFGVIGANMADLLRQDGVRGWKAWGGGMRLLWLRPGLLRRIALPYLDYFRPGFHPWDTDDRALTRQAERELATAYPAGMAA